MNGEVVQFDDKKGFGFIQPDDRSERIFVHATAVTSAARLAVGQRVTFDVTPSAKGQRASNVVIAGAPAMTPTKAKPLASPYWLFGMIAAVGTAVITVLLTGLLPISWLWAYLIGINLVTLLLYVYDRGVAGSGALRVPERILHGAELLGGTPAGFAGQRLLRHKAAKGSYQRTFWIICAGQALLLFTFIYLGAV